MELRFTPLRSRSESGWAEARRIYEESFPRCERRADADYDAALADPRFTADAIRLDGRIVGILYHWRGEGFRYIEYLAFDPAMRGRNLGTRALEAFCAADPAPVILEIEPPVDVPTRRRRDFYARRAPAAEPPGEAHARRSPPFRGLREGTRAPLLGARRGARAPAVAAGAAAPEPGGIRDQQIQRARK